MGHACPLFAMGLEPRCLSRRALLQAAKAFEADVVVPHCPACSRPCCGLSDVVLELSFPQEQRLYAITRPQKDFDAALPPMIRKQGGAYFAHGAACPAFDTHSHRCGVYGTDAKPQSCSDFPVYDDGDAVTADLRCEAVRTNLEQLRARLAAVVAVSGGQLVEERDPDHADTFVSFLQRPSAKTAKKPKKATSSS